MKKLLATLFLFGALAHAQAPVIHQAADPMTPNCIDTRLIFSNASNNVFIGKNGTCYTFNSGGGGGGTSIGGAVTGGTDGSVLFVHPGGILAQDNANLFWDATNHKLGIGNSSPGASLDVRPTLAVLDSDLVGASFSFTTHSNADGIDLEHTYSGSTDQSSEVALYLQNGVNPSGGHVVTDDVGIKVDSITAPVMGSVTNYYAIKIEDQIQATNNYSIKSGLGKVDHGDFTELHKDLAVDQGADGDDAVAIYRFTNAAPTGYLLTGYSNGGGTRLFDIDVLGGGYFRNFLTLQNVVAPSSPGAGMVSIYPDSTDLRFHDKNASGAIGTTVVADTGAANNFLTAVSTSGIISKAQPTYSNISGGTATLPAGTLPGFTYSGGFAGRATAVTDTTMVTPGADAEYRFSATINCTTTSAAAVATLNLKYKDTSGTAQTTSVSDTCTSLITTGVPNMILPIRAQSGTAVTWGVTITNTPTFDVFVRLEAM